MLLSFVAILAMVMLTPATASKSKTYPRLSAAEKKDRILIVAPHIDDEAISAGGYTIDAIANGAEVYVVFLTAGDCNQFSARLLHKTLEPTASNYLSVGKTRIAEAKEAMKILGVTPDHFFILGYPDRGLRTMVDNPDAVVRSRGTRAHEVPYDDALSPGSQYKIENALNDLKQVIATARPTTVIAPVPFDKHPDHAAAAEIVDVCCFAIRSFARTSCSSFIRPRSRKVNWRESPARANGPACVLRPAKRGEGGPHPALRATLSPLARGEGSDSAQCFADR